MADDTRPLLLAPRTLFAIPWALASWRGRFGEETVAECRSANTKGRFPAVRVSNTGTICLVVAEKEA
eukprot:scaffold6829_cov171-Amphora_coffeaeformis.AAC.18